MNEMSVHKLRPTYYDVKERLSSSLQTQDLWFSHRCSRFLPGPGLLYGLLRHEAYYWKWNTALLTLGRLMDVEPLRVDMAGLFVPDSWMRLPGRALRGRGAPLSTVTLCCSPSTTGPASETPEQVSSGRYSCRKRIPFLSAGFLTFNYLISSPPAVSERKEALLTTCCCGESPIVLCEAVESRRKGDLLVSHQILEAPRRLSVCGQWRVWGVNERRSAAVSPQSSERRQIFIWPPLDRTGLQAGRQAFCSPLFQTIITTTQKNRLCASCRKL